MRPNPRKALGSICAVLAAALAVQAVMEFRRVRRQNSWHVVEGVVERVHTSQGPSTRLDSINGTHIGPGLLRTEARVRYMEGSSETTCLVQSVPNTTGENQVLFVRVHPAGAGDCEMFVGIFPSRAPWLFAGSLLTGLLAIWLCWQRRRSPEPV